MYRNTQTSFDALPRVERYEPKHDSALVQRQRTTQQNAIAQRVTDVNTVLSVAQDACTCQRDQFANVIASLLTGINSRLR